MGYAVLALILISLMAVFVLQNSGAVEVSFFFWRLEAPLAVIVFLSAVAGMLVAIAVTAAVYVRRNIARKKTAKDAHL